LLECGVLNYKIFTTNKKKQYTAVHVVKGKILQSLYYGFLSTLITNISKQLIFMQFIKDRAPKPTKNKMKMKEVLVTSFQHSSL
jgi:hypothetical protein